MTIPVWVPLTVKRRIPELSGHTVWSRDFKGDIGSDNSKEMGVVDWVTPG